MSSQYMLPFWDSLPSVPVTRHLWDWEPTVKTLADIGRTVTGSAGQPPLLPGLVESCETGATNNGHQETVTA